MRDGFERSVISARDAKAAAVTVAVIVGWCAVLYFVGWIGGALGTGLALVLLYGWLRAVA